MIQVTGVLCFDKIWLIYTSGFHTLIYCLPFDSPYNQCGDNDSTRLSL